MFLLRLCFCQSTYLTMGHPYVSKYTLLLQGFFFNFSLQDKSVIINGQENIAPTNNKVQSLSEIYKFFAYSIRNFFCNLFENFC